MKISFTNLLANATGKLFPRAHVFWSNVLFFQFFAVFPVALKSGSETGTRTYCRLFKISIESVPKGKRTSE